MGNGARQVRSGNRMPAGLWKRHRDRCKSGLPRKNDFGVLDHYVTTAQGVEIYVPMRVVPNGSGSEVMFTLFKTPDMSDKQFADDAGMVERDLKTLKSVMER